MQPDHVISASTAEIAPATLDDATLAITLTTACPYCGKTQADYLTLSEAFALSLDYARSNCLYCQLTDMRRHNPARIVTPG